MALAVIPIGAGLIGADLNVGVLYLVALGSIGIMAALMAGWGSNNKCALLAGFRVVAGSSATRFPWCWQLAPVLLVNTMRRNWPRHSRSSSAPSTWALAGLSSLLPGAFLIYFISALARANKHPSTCSKTESGWWPVFISSIRAKVCHVLPAQFLNSFSWAPLPWHSSRRLAGSVRRPDSAARAHLFHGHILHLCRHSVDHGTPSCAPIQMMQFAWKVLGAATDADPGADGGYELPLPGRINSLLVLVANIGLHRRAQHQRAATPSRDAVPSAS